MRSLQTARLLLRPFRHSDLSALNHYARSPHVGPHAGWPPHASREESRRVLDEFIREDEVWAVVRREDGTLIGSIGLHADPKRPYEGARMLGYALGEPYWGNGYAAEAAGEVIRFAFEVQRVSILSLYHYAYNQRSRRVAEKCGLVREGMLRAGCKRYDGKVLDEVCYSLTLPEYEERLSQGFYLPKAGREEDVR
ncbi:MAG: GNAT family N-acetyltransferase [Provencibacterium sp.]|jgi:ribosomal-protein-alanine N-acetyltransferase|nr:GNAT family N-acetyltransferase [Provencibacterium sp.]